MDVDITYKEEEWEAIHDHMGKQLHVHGVCHIRGGGFAAGLEPHEKPLPNPMMLPLDLVVHATGETPSSVPVDWKQPWDDEGYQYTEVSFFVRDVNAKPPPTLKIKDVH